MLKTRLVNAVFGLAILLGLVVMFWFVLPQLARLRSAPRIANTPNILLQVQNLSQLITVKYVMEKVIVYEDKQWFGDSRVLMIAHANVLAGIDLKEIKPGDIEVTGKTIKLKLPKAKAPMAYTAIDDARTKVVERTTGMLRTFDKDMEQNARKQAVLDINLAAVDAGILKDADDRAKSQLSNLFQSMGFEKVEFVEPGKN